MEVKYVTLTGADDDVSQGELFEIAAQHPFVEWGILFSQSKAGVSRYPSWDWVEELMKYQVSHISLTSWAVNLSAHLCGKWVSDALKGKIYVPELFGRVQLNCYKDRLRQAFASDVLMESMAKAKKSVILGGNFSGLNTDMCHGHNLLFDASGGHGTLTKRWPEKVKGAFCGYAGGLGPDNIEKQLQLIEEVVGDAEVWIDMETKVRTNNKFDLDKCREVLKIAKKWVK